MCPQLAVAAASASAGAAAGAESAVAQALRIDGEADLAAAH